MQNGEAKPTPKKRGRWDQTVEETFVPAKKKTLSVSTPSTAATPVWEGDVSMNIKLKFLIYYSKRFSVLPNQLQIQICIFCIHAI